MRKQLFNLLVLYVLWITAGVFGSILIQLYFMNAGVGLVELVGAHLFWAPAPILAMFFMSKKPGASFKNHLLVGIALMAMSYVLLLVLQPSASQLFIYYFLIGITNFMFWVPFNIMYFELSSGKEAQLSSVYFSIIPLLSMILPFISGVVAEQLGFGALFVITIFIYAAAFVFARDVVEERTHEYDIGGCLKELKGFKTLLVIDGIQQSSYSAAFLVISLLYFTKPTEFGGFISLTTLFAVIASFIVSKMSDKARKRWHYIILFGIATGIATILGAFATDAFLWYVALSARNFFVFLFMPFTTAIIMDRKLDTAKAMIGREVLLGIGRFIGIVIILYSAIVLDNIRLSLLFLGFIVMLYPLVIELKKRHIAVE